MYLGDALEKFDKVRLPHWGGGQYVYTDRERLIFGGTGGDAKKILSFNDLVSGVWEGYVEPVGFVEACIRWERFRRRSWAKGIYYKFHSDGSLISCITSWGHEVASLQKDYIFATDWEEYVE
jgi:hypothetical protein